MLHTNTIAVEQSFNVHFSYSQQVSGNSDRIASWTFAIDTVSLNFDHAYASTGSRVRERLGPYIKR